MRFLRDRKRVLLPVPGRAPYIAANGPGRASSVSSGPCSATWPSLITTTRSAIRTVESRWAMMNVVRPACRRSRASMMSRSVSGSSADVGSSRMRIGESRRIARAMVSRCFSPSESVTPCSPTTVS